MGLFAGYTRVSRVGDRAEGLISPRLQEEAIEAWARQHDHQVEMLPPELDASGGSDRRPILMGAIERVERGELAGIAVWKFSRFTRSTRLGLQMLERIEGAGGQLRSASEQLDPATVQGRTFRNIIFAFDQGEREQKAEEFERAKADAIARGVFIGPRAPLGYIRGAEKRLEVDPEVGPLITELFERKAAGASWGELSKWLSGKLGRIVIPGSVRAIIRNRTYLGEVRQGSHRNPEAHQPLVDVGTWQAAQVQAPRPPRGSAGPALLAGLVRCAGCSRSMTAGRGGGKRVYECRRRHTGGTCSAPAAVLADRLEGYVVDVVLSHIASIAVRGESRTDTLDQAVAALDHAVAERDGFLEAAQIAEVGAEHVATELRRRADAVEEAKRALARVRMAGTWSADSAHLDQLWPSLGADERRHVLRGSLGVVWVRSGRAALRDRVRVIAAGEEPAGLSSRGRAAGPVVPLEGWVDLPGEIGAPHAEDLAESSAGAEASSC